MYMDADNKLVQFCLVYKGSVLPDIECSVRIFALRCVCVWMYRSVCTIMYVQCVCVWMYRSVHSSVYVCGCIDLCTQVCICVDVLIFVLKCVCVLRY